jgi:hypothetical protein
MSRRIPIAILRQILLRISNNHSDRRIVRELEHSISRSAIQSFRQKINELEFTEEDIRELSDKELSMFIYGSLPSQTYKPSEVRQLILSKIKYFKSELEKNDSVTQLLLWEEFIEENPEFGICSYQTFCRVVSPHLKTKDPSFHNNRPTPGSVLMIDFAGAKLYYTDRETNKKIPCVVFVGILGYSLYSFVDILPDGRTPHVLQALNNCMNFLGGVPERILTDNMAQLVKKADKYEPTFTDAAVEWSNHYGAFLSATRVARPKDKSAAERLVMIAYQRIYAALRNLTFYSLEELKGAVILKLEMHNRRKLSGKSCSRLDIFKQEEQPVLKPLPDNEFELQKITRGKVHKDYHVYFGEDQSFYSVPFELIGKKLDIRYTAKKVEIFDLLHLVATHARNLNKGSYTTSIIHMPPNHKAQQEVNGWTKEDFLKQARLIGPYTLQMIENFFVDKKHESHAYRPCQGLLNLSTKIKYGLERLEHACELAIELNWVSYKKVEFLLKKGYEKNFIANKRNGKWKPNVRCKNHLRGKEDFE